MPLSLRLPPQLEGINASNIILHGQFYTEACSMADLAHFAEAANCNT